MPARIVAVVVIALLTFAVGPSKWSYHFGAAAGVFAAFLTVAVVLVGVALVALGWYGASGVSEVWKEIPYLISGGIGGLTVTVIGAALYLRASLARQQRLVLVRMLQEQRTQTDRLVEALDARR